MHMSKSSILCILLCIFKSTSWCSKLDLFVNIAWQEPMQKTTTFPWIIKTVEKSKVFSDVQDSRGNSLQHLTSVLCAQECSKCPSYQSTGALLQWSSSNFPNSISRNSKSWPSFCTAHPQSSNGSGIRICTVFLRFLP